MTDYDFEDRLGQIALPMRGNHDETSGASAAAIASLVLLAVGVGLAIVFGVLGFVLLFFCIGILVWYAGAFIVLLITGTGALFGLVAVVSNFHRPAQQVIGLLGLVLNSAVAVACACLLSRTIR